ncbi:hypothetical protein [Blastococcus montanus]|uniref:hypothetical protein n=1 Tax=Blastococcus montanus TaxID=3144973 RepID=UPI0032095D98
MPEDRAEPTAGASGASGVHEGTTVRSAWTWWLAAPAFVLGMIVGAVTLGLLREDPPLPAAAAEAPPDSAEESPGAAPTPSPGASAEITVNEACLRVVNETQDLVDVIEGLGSSAADLDIAGVDQSIRRLQPLETRLRADLAACEADTDLPADLSPTPDTGEPADDTADPAPTSAPG